jgi:hypothetical protein
LPGRDRFHTVPDHPGPVRIAATTSGEALAQNGGAVSGDGKRKSGTTRKSVEPVPTEIDDPRRASKDDFLVVLIDVLFPLTAMAERMGTGWNPSLPCLMMYFAQVDFLVVPIGVFVPSGPPWLF